jgi:hypothetical protein
LRSRHARSGGAMGPQCIPAYGLDHGPSDRGSQTLCEIQRPVRSGNRVAAQPILWSGPPPTSAAHLYRAGNRVFAAGRESTDAGRRSAPAHLPHDFRSGGGHARPRIHDLRHTFICGTLLRSYQQNQRIDHVIDALSTYVGHAKVSDTYWYITAVPELMAAAAQRFLPLPAGDEL